MEETMEEIELRDIVRILWKRKWVVIITTLIAALIAGIVAFATTYMRTPVYTASVKIDLGNFNNELYTKPQAAQQVILSKDTLEPISRKLNSVSVETIQSSLRVILINDTHILQIQSSYKDPETAKKIVEELTNEFLKKSNLVYQEQKDQMEQSLASLQKYFDQTAKDLDRNKAALTIVESQNTTQTDKEQTINRLTNYILQGENSMNRLFSKIQELKTKFADIHKATIVEQANVSNAQNPPKKLLIVTLGVVVGFMLSLLLVYLIEYFSNNPLQLRNEKELKG